jgi:hypothetical protein
LNARSIDDPADPVKCPARPKGPGAIGTRVQISNRVKVIVQPLRAVDRDQPLQF